MANRLNLQAELSVLPNVKKAYFQPPASVKMVYPCVRYVLSGLNAIKANDKMYHGTKRYSVTVIDTDPDSEIYLEIMSRFPMCSFDRFYTADNLNHWVLTLYY